MDPGSPQGCVRLSLPYITSSFMCELHNGYFILLIYFLLKYFYPAFPLAPDSLQSTIQNKTKSYIPKVSTVNTPLKALTNKMALQHLQKISRDMASPGSSFNSKKKAWALADARSLLLRELLMKVLCKNLSKQSKLLTKVNIKSFIKQSYYTWVSWCARVWGVLLKLTAIC